MRKEGGKVTFPIEMLKSTDKTDYDDKTSNLDRLYIV